MRLHINCTEFGQPWASITFMLNISEKYEMEITFSMQAFFPKLCRDALIPTRQHRMALVWLSFPSLEVYPAFAVGLQPWVIFSLTAASFIPPFSAFFSLLFVLKIYHTQGSQKQPHTHKMAFLWMLKLVYLSLGLFRAEIRHWCKCGSSTDNEKHAYYFFPKYIYSYQLFQFLSPSSPKSLSVPRLWLGSRRRLCTSGEVGREVAVQLALHQHLLQYFSSLFSPCSLPLPPAPWTWLPGWLPKEKMC